IELHDVHKTYHTTQVLNGVSYEFEESKVSVIIGPSGSGKSTMLRCLNALESIQDGKILFKGDDIAIMNANHLRQRIGMVFQDYNLFPHLTVFENLCLSPLRILKRQRSEVEE